MADCHLGSWSSHPDMREYPILAFESAINECLHEKVDFIIIAGDLFDTSLPPIDVLKRAAAAFRRCREAGVPVYAISGSHDYSPTGKTMLSVLEETGVLTDLCKTEQDNGKIRLKITEDKKTGTKFAGFMGKKGSLEVNQYKDLVCDIEREQGFKIFVFHAALSEYRPENMKDMAAVSAEDLPKGFDYYATGHVHTQMHDKKYSVVFPGELFPTSFDELEDYNGGFVIVDTTKGIDVRWKNMKMFRVAMAKFNVSGKTPSVIEDEITRKIETTDLKNTLLLLKLYGTIEAGKISDLNFNAVAEKARAKGALAVKRNTSGVSVKEFSEVSVEQNLTTEQIEKGLIEKHADQLQMHGVSDPEDFILGMMQALNQTKMEDETNAVFEERLKAEAKKVAGL